MSADPRISHTVFPSGEIAIVRLLIEEHADQFATLRLDRDAHAPNERMELMMSALQALRLGAGPGWISVGEHDVSLGLKLPEFGPKHRLRRRQGSVCFTDSLIEGVEVDLRIVRYPSLDRWHQTQDQESENRQAMNPRIPCSAAHLLAIVTTVAMIECGDAGNLQPLPIDPAVEDSLPGRGDVLQSKLSPPPDRELPSGWRRWLEPLPEPVFEAALAVDDGWVAVVGGFDTSMHSVPYVQVHHPQDGWLPIAAQMKEPRAQHAMIQLSSGEWFICGGVSGTANRDPVALATCEIIRLNIAGSQVADSLDEPIARPTIHRLSRGRIAVVGGHHVHVFDETVRRWIRPIGLQDQREAHASVALDDHRLLVVGGDAHGLIEEVNLDDPASISRAWPATLDIHIERPAAALLADGRVLLVGGYSPVYRETLYDTWILDPRRQSICRGPVLPDRRGACAVMIRASECQAYIMGGEWRAGDRRGEANLNLVIRPEDRFPIWRVRPLPAPNYASAWVDLNGLLGVIGGYRFVPPDSVAADQPAGPLVEARSWLGWVGLETGGD